MGRHAADVILDRLRKRAPQPFRYRHYGNLATIGRTSAVIDFGRLRLRGWIAWWVWGIAHIYFLISLRNRVLVAVQWLWLYATFQRGARLITGNVD
jgi:NADH:ubiquinone reductase (H+-translocating)